MADQRRVVLKVLDADHCDASDVARLRNELELGRTLKGLSVVEPLALSTFHGLPALELEEFRGVSLDRLAGAPMPIDVFLCLATRLAHTVAAIHALGLVHKDLKPHNILFDADSGEVKIADFCIASRIAREQTTTRPIRLIEGSLPYVSPEQTGRMNRSIDGRSDLYSLGITFYQLLTGRLPFEATDAIGWVHCHVARKPPAPEEVRSAVPAQLSAVVLKLLAKAPEDRYQTASGLASDLEHCLQQWSETGRIAPFPVGERDVSDCFLIPQRLYGRTAECTVLKEAFERVVATGAPELVLVVGSSGSGKSSLVNELHRPIVARRGLFVTGKFEQYKRDIPYLTLVQAFRELMLDIVAESADSIAAWQSRIQAALGPNGQLIVDLIPEVGLIIGPQPAVPELSLADAENRLRRVLRELLGAFTTREHPLVIFLDDLQWADAASLRLLVDVVTHPETHHLLFLGAYRDNEVGPGHPLVRALDEARAEGAALRTLVVPPLTEAHLSELVADTLHVDLGEVAPLARLLCKKTGGNPFFLIQFLSALHRDGSIAFDRGRGQWGWDLARIRAQSHADNVVELMLGKLRDLPAETQEALKLAACLGGTLDAERLALVLGREPEAALGAAFEESLLLRLDDTYRFAHDRVQEAAYGLIANEERPALHLRIGRLLLRRTPLSSLEEQIFDIVNQLNRGLVLVTSRRERERIAELNLMAGQRAQRSAAHASALRYFATGADLLGAGAWSRRYELGFALQIHWAECEMVTGEFQGADKRLQDLLARARSVADAGAVAYLQVMLFMSFGQGLKAVEASLAYLRRVGIDWPLHPSREDANQEISRIWQRLAGRQIEELIDLPPMTDPDCRATVDVITIASAPMSFFDENLVALAMARAVNLSLEHGNSDASPQAFVLLGEILGPYYDDYRIAFRFGKLGFDLLERKGPLRFKAIVYLLFALMVNPWGRHVRTSVELERRAFEAAQQTGNVQFACYALNDIVTFRLASGDPLEEVERSVAEALAFARKAKFGLVEDTLITKLRLIRMLRGLTPSIASFDGDDFREDEFERHLESSPSLVLGAGWHWIRKLQGRYLGLDHAGAVAAATKAASYLWTGRAYPEIAEYQFYAGLTYAAACDHEPGERQAQNLQAVAEHHRKLEKWAESCPENFANRAALVGAELARLTGDPEKAARLYERAIHSARDNGFVQQQALAHETAARFYRARGFELIADAYLREARDCYHRWGAEGKVRQLEERHPALVEADAASAITVALRAEQLDLLSVVKASQTISGVMAEEPLLATLLRLVLEQGGARRAAVLLTRDGRLECAAQIASDDSGASSSEPPSRDLPQLLVEYVQRTHDRVLLDDAAADPGRFAGDDYLARARPRSVLCLPIRRQAKVVGVLYLENELLPGAFTPERLVALELLATQAAISLENALLLEHERAGRVEAEAAERRARLLGEATAIMTSTLDYAGVFGELTEVCVRSFADWAIIDVIEGGKVSRLAGAHHDSEKEPLLRELSERYPAALRSPSPAAEVLSAGKPLLVSNMDEAYIRAHTADDRHFDLIRQLGSASAIVVPLVARDSVLGALTLAAATPGRFGPADLELATEIGRRAALAMDNARLLRETQRAVQLRDDFLSVASHELRTPVTSLMITVEHLLRSGEAGKPLSSQSLFSGLNRVKHSAERLRRLTDELLDVTRIQQRQLELDRVAVDLAALLREVVEGLEPELAAARCSVHIDAPEAVVGAWDRSRLEQVVTNLLTNAVKFGAGRPIELRVRQAASTAQLSVQDHGVGIDPARKPFLFNRFERAVSSAHYGGLGLGLYISRRIVEAHGGDLRVDSEPGQGATFTVTLPRTVPTSAPLSK